MTRELGGEDGCYSSRAKKPKKNVLQNATDTLETSYCRVKEKEAAVGAQLSQAVQRGKT